MQQMMQLGWPMMLLMMLLCVVFLAAVIALVALAVDRFARTQ